MRVYRTEDRGSRLDARGHSVPMEPRRYENPQTKGQRTNRLSDPSSEEIEQWARRGHSDPEEHDGEGDRMSPGVRRGRIEPASEGVHTGGGRAWTERSPAVTPKDRTQTPRRLSQEQLLEASEQDDEDSEQPWTESDTETEHAEHEHLGLSGSTREAGEPEGGEDLGEQPFERETMFERNVREQDQRWRRPLQAGKGSPNFDLGGGLFFGRRGR
jgi:hypothetical protein